MPPESEGAAAYDASVDARLVTRYARALADENLRLQARAEKAERQVEAVKAALNRRHWASPHDFSFAIADIVGVKYDL